MHSFISFQKISEAFKAVGSSVKKAELLSGAWGGDYAVAAIVVDGICPPAEVHEKAADIWIVLSGSATFILGGNLIEPSLVREGEWTASTIGGGEKHTVRVGDVVDVPPGVPHQVDATSSRAEFLILKVNT